MLSVITLYIVHTFIIFVRIFSVLVLYMPLCCDAEECLKEDLTLRLAALPDSRLDLLSAAANRAEAAGLAQVMILLLWKQVASDDNLSDIKEEIRG